MEVLESLTDGDPRPCVEAVLERPHRERRPRHKGTSTFPGALQPHIRAAIGLILEHLVRVKFTRPRVIHHLRQESDDLPVLLIVVARMLSPSST